MYEKKGYNAEVDFWRLFFAIIVFLRHARFVFSEGPVPFERGYMAVEFFFIVSGYFMAATIRSNAEKNIVLPTDAFLKRKLQVFYQVLIASLIIGFVTREWLSDDRPLIVFRNFFMSFYQAGLARLYGLIITKTYNGPDWYMSAMMIATAILYPLGKKYQRPFFTVACPMLALSGYGLLFQVMKTMNVTETAIEGCGIMAGVIRAMAGLCVGMFVNECCTRVKEKNRIPTTGGKVVFAAAELLTLFCILYYCDAAARLSWTTDADFCVVLLFALFCFLVFSELTGIKQLLAERNVDFTVLSKISLYLYLSHRIVTFILIDQNVEAHASYWQVLPVYIGMTIGSMALCRCIVFLFDRFGRDVLPRVRHLLFVDSETTSEKN